MDMPLLKVENLAVEKIEPKTGHAVPLLENVTIEIEKNKITGLIGESGAGKTIFSKTLSALLPGNVFVTKGTIFYDGRPIDYEMLKKKRGAHIFYTPQNAAASLNPVIKIKRRIYETSRIEPARLIEILRDLDVDEPEHLLHAYPFQLSGGENQRCLLAMAAALQPELLILDEPFASLDYHVQHGFTALIKKIQQQYNLTILLISHNLSIVGNISDTIYVILKGKIVEKGTPGELFSSPTHEYTKEIVNYPLAGGTYMRRLCRDTLQPLVPMETSIKK